MFKYQSESTPGSHAKLQSHTRTDAREKFTSSHTHTHTNLCQQVGFASERSELIDGLVTLGTKAALEPDWCLALTKPGQELHNETQRGSEGHLRAALYPSGSKQSHNVFIAGLSVC